MPIEQSRSERAAARLADSEPGARSPGAIELRLRVSCRGGRVRCAICGDVAAARPGAADLHRLVRIERINGSSFERPIFECRFPDNRGAIAPVTRPVGGPTAVLALSGGLR